MPFAHPVVREDVESLGAPIPKTHQTPPPATRQVRHPIRYTLIAAGFVVLAGIAGRLLWPVLESRLASEEPGSGDAIGLPAAAEIEALTPSAFRDAEKRWAGRLAQARYVSRLDGSVIPMDHGGGMWEYRISDLKSIRPTTTAEAAGEPRQVVVYSLGQPTVLDPGAPVMVFATMRHTDNRYWGVLVPRAGQRSLPAASSPH